jgi:hypothetical protein
MFEMILFGRSQSETLISLTQKKKICVCLRSSASSKGRKRSCTLGMPLFFSNSQYEKTLSTDCTDLADFSF